jgi:putative redox protein
MGTQTLRWRAGDEDFTGTDSYGRSTSIMAGEGAPGLKPSDLLPMSLAACTGYTLVSILRKQRQDVRALEATIEAHQDDEPPWRFRSIAVHFVARGDVDQRKAEKALERSHEKWCSVSATLRDVVKLEFDIRIEPA